LHLSISCNSSGSIKSSRAFTLISPQHLSNSFLYT
jgi:hypothetical protein